MDGTKSIPHRRQACFRCARSEDLRSVIGSLAAEFYRRPSEHLLSIGVTGTNGKTSSTQWIAQLLTRAGRRCAVIGTIGVGFADEPLTETSLTTPDPVSLQREVRALLDAGAQAIAMEVSSIGLEQGRLNGMKVDVALFTNLTRDHLDYHGTMQRYEAAKSLLFDWPTLSHAVINLDDAAGRRLIPKLAERGVDVIGYSAASMADAGETKIEPPIAHRLSARAIRATSHGLAFEVEPRRSRDSDRSAVGRSVQCRKSARRARCHACLRHRFRARGRRTAATCIRRWAACNKSCCLLRRWRSSITRTRPMRWQRRLRRCGRSSKRADHKEPAENYGSYSVPAAIATPASAHRWALLPRKVPTLSSSPAITHDRKTPKRSLRRSRPEQQTRAS